MRPFDDPAVPRVPSLIPEGAPKVLMTIFPHPDDEITAAGTLILERAQGARTILACLTRGEASPAGGCGPAMLGVQRSEELRSAGAILGAAAVELFDFPDGGVERTEPERLREAIRGLIRRHRPSVLVTYDEKIGLYGHPDHLWTARRVLEVFDRHRHEPDFPVRKVYRVTLPPGMIKLGLKVSRMFREHYPADPARGLPPPDAAVEISSVGALKKKALYAHVSQRAILDDLQPGVGYLPGWAYYRIFSAEYFASY